MLKLLARLFNVFGNMFAIAFFIAVVAYGIWNYRQKKNEEHLLENYGKVTEGFIRGIDEGKKGKPFVYYYWVSGQMYKNTTPTNVEVTIGDTVDVTYYPEDPQISISQLRRKKMAPVKAPLSY
jgi:hypothetical protein